MTLFKVNCDCGREYILVQNDPDDEDEVLVPANSGQDLYEPPDVPADEIRVASFEEGAIIPGRPDVEWVDITSRVGFRARER